MGWTSTNRTAGQTNREFFGRELDAKYEIIADTTIRSVWYAAIRNTETGVVDAAVVLIQRAPRSYYNFTYKWMSEDMGPNAIDAPAKILNLLTPTENQYAAEWRRQCSAALAKKALAPSTKGLTDGDQIRLKTPLTFTDGTERDVFEIRLSPDRAGRKQVRLFAPGTYVRYQVPRWRDRVAEVIPA